MEYTKEELISIADFMGWVHHPDKSYDAYEMATLQYHRKYDWIMPVVDRIEHGNYGVKICRRVCEIYDDETKEVVVRKKEPIKIHSICSAIIEFIARVNKKELEFSID